MDSRKALILLLVVYVLFTTLRLTAPYDIDSHDQAKQGLYVLDVVQNGHLVLPMEHGDKPATKPPLYNWAAAGISLVRGDVTDITIRLPSVVCGFGVVVVTFLLGEMLFTGTVGLFAGLILILNYHFIKVSCLARTDMMLCFFIIITLYFFLLAYRRRRKRSIYNVLAFATMGLGSITKGPIGLIVPMLVILVYLLFKKDLKHLKSMQLPLGFAIWMVITLGWFIPAWIEGGRAFFDIVVRDEMVNRFLGVGTRAAKSRPFYYLVGHFFGKFLPWSLFTAPALVWFWKSDERGEKDRLLFPVAWFFVTLAFFSLSRGKRADYIVPLYPAASLIVAQLWTYALKRETATCWTSSLRVLSCTYLFACSVAVAGLSAFSLAPRLADTIKRVAPGSSQDAELLYNALTRHMGIFLTAAFLIIAVSGGGVLLERRKQGLTALFVATLVVAGLSISLYFHLLSEEAVTLDGRHKKTFCTEAARIVGTTGNVAFCGIKNSISFYMDRNTRYLTDAEVIEFFRTTDNPYAVTTETDYRSMREHPDFEFIVLERSQRSVKRNGGRFVLLGRKNALSDTMENRPS